LIMNESATFEKDRAIELVATPTRNLFDDCMRFANYYVRVKHNAFSSEDMIYLFQVTHQQHPVEKRVWGAVINRLHKDGKIRHAGYGKYKNPKGHCKPVNIWISTL
jgi:hypothetical protein